MASSHDFDAEMATKMDGFTLFSLKFFSFVWFICLACDNGNLKFIVDFLSIWREKQRWSKKQRATQTKRAWKERKARQRRNWRGTATEMKKEVWGEKERNRVILERKGKNREGETKKVSEKEDSRRMFLPKLSFLAFNQFEMLKLPLQSICDVVRRKKRYQLFVVV